MSRSLDASFFWCHEQCACASCGGGIKDLLVYFCLLRSFFQMENEKKPRLFWNNMKWNVLYILRIYLRTSLKMEYFDSNLFKFPLKLIKRKSWTSLKTINADSNAFHFPFNFKLIKELKQAWNWKILIETCFNSSSEFEILNHFPYRLSNCFYFYSLTKLFCFFPQNISNRAVNNICRLFDAFKNRNFPISIIEFSARKLRARHVLLFIANWLLSDVRGYSSKRPEKFSDIFDTIKRTQLS